MSAGMFIAGTVMSILSIASFEAGGLWCITGVACMFAWVGIAIHFYNEDQEIKPKGLYTS